MRIVYALKGSTEGEIKDLRRGNKQAPQSTHTHSDSRLPQNIPEHYTVYIRRVYAEDTLQRPVCNLGRDEDADEGAAGTLRGQRGKPFCIARQTFVGS